MALIYVRDDTLARLRRLSASSRRPIAAIVDAWAKNGDASAAGPALKSGPKKKKARRKENPNV